VVAVESTMAAAPPCRCRPNPGPLVQCANTSTSARSNADRIPARKTRSFGLDIRGTQFRPTRVRDLSKHAQKTLARNASREAMHERRPICHMRVARPYCSTRCLALCPWVLAGPVCRGFARWVASSDDHARRSPHLIARVGDGPCPASRTRLLSGRTQTSALPHADVIVAQCRMAGPIPNPAKVKLLVTHCERVHKDMPCDSQRATWCCLKQKLCRLRAASCRRRAARGSPWQRI
jgi:hypothetical protein